MKFNPDGSIELPDNCIQKKHPGNAEYEKGLNHYLTGRYEYAVANFLRASEFAHPSSFHFLSYLFQNGRGVTLNKTLGDQWSRKAGEFKEWFISEANRENPDAQNILGYWYNNGITVIKDDKIAASWYQKAADFNHPIAQANLGTLYMTGNGVPKDPKQGFFWYNKAAEHGSGVAQCAVANCYLRAMGVDKDEKLAAALLRKSADRGNATALTGLAICYATGKGVEKDTNEYLRLLKEAYHRGDKEAITLIKKYEDARKLAKPPTTMEERTLHENLGSMPIDQMKPSIGNFINYQPHTTFKEEKCGVVVVIGSISEPISFTNRSDEKLSMTSRMIETFELLTEKIESKATIEKGIAEKRLVKVLGEPMEQKGLFTAKVIYLHPIIFEKLLREPEIVNISFKIGRELMLQGHIPLIEIYPFDDLGYSYAEEAARETLRYLQPKENYSSSPRVYNEGKARTPPPAALSVTLPPSRVHPDPTKCCSIL